MNFFSQQDRARRNTLWLIILLTGAVTCLIIMTIMVTAVAIYYLQDHTTSNSTPYSLLESILTTNIPLWAASAVLAVVACGSTFKWLQLGGSGRRVAESLGGTLIMPNTRTAEERKILNVVEEMAIASGNPVPPVYILEETGINAFAAGMDRRNAVIGITRGCIQLLSREELQGVIAHEFSHIHFGDMRINLRLVAILHGILIIGLVGYHILPRRTYGYSHNSGKKDNNSAQLALGFALIALGYCGVFFGNIIKAAVSRQREFLADASSVQFTRNPNGIANALKKIGGASGQATLNTPRASEFSHFYFGEGVSSTLGSIMATHPPLEQRIKRVQPNWDGQFIQPSPAQTQQARQEKPQRKAENRQEQLSEALVMGASIMGTVSKETAAMPTVEQIGNPTEENLNNAKRFIKELPQTLKDAAREPFSARALVYCLLTDKVSSKCKQRQVAYLKKQAHPVSFKAFLKLSQEVEHLQRRQYLPLLDLAIPAIKMQSKHQYVVFKKNLVAIIKADSAVSLFEWCLYRVITQGYEGNKQGGSKTLDSMGPAINTIIAAVCYSGKNQSSSLALNAARSFLPDISLPQNPDSNLGSNITFQDLDKAIGHLSLLRPLEKPKLLKALSACIQADSVVTNEEAELFRALADCLDCPVPLLNYS